MVFQDYLTFLRQLKKELEELTAVEQEKIQAVRSGDLETLDVCMKKEQAIALALRGKEQHRVAMLEELGLTQVSLRDLAGRAPEELRQETAGVTEDVLRVYQVLKSAQDTARTLMEADLHVIEKQLERQGGVEKQAPESKPRQTDFRA